eukprot:TRINITY_DN1421_c0_g1_i1.p1 TRINITY_DN1421_c0_g1~~TRINITY_DN1421_c0_g1_i1.p1  ORF type:complete len:281 (+),score=44.11 TRINITY_DN1421_c0_g1_i1:289-1131(+)
MKYMLSTSSIFGFFSLNSSGWAKVTTDVNSATDLVLEEYDGNKYFTVGNGDYKGYYIGYLDVNNTYVCATKNWGLARYILQEGDKISFNGNDGRKMWKVSPELEVRVGTAAPFDVATINSYQPIPGSKIDKLAYFKFGKKLHQIETIEMYVKSYHSVSRTTTIDTNVSYAISAEAGIPVADLIKAQGSSKSSWHLHMKSEMSEKELLEKYTKRTVKLTGDLTVWYIVDRYKYGDTEIYSVNDLCFVKDGVNPGVGDEALVQITYDGAIMMWKDAKEHLSK